MSYYFNVIFFFFKQKTAYEMRISDWSSDVCSSDLEIKPDESPVTLADRAAEQAMRALIEAERPQDGIVGEEFGVRAGTSGRQWVLDPIDGTRAFISGRPIFGTRIDRKSVV